MPHAIDFAAELYSRQEGRGMVIGTYEKACVPWSPKTTPWDFGHELLQPDFDRIGPSLDMAFRSDEHTSELQSLMRISYAVFCLKKKKSTNHTCASRSATPTH